MNYHTPLRYPGGKRRLISVVAQLLEWNQLGDIEYAEPFAGGASVALEMLMGEYASTIHLNDLSRPIYSFWHTVLFETEWLCKRIQTARFSMPAWKMHRRIYDQRDTAEMRELGFATLFLNRTNRSGIISGGVIGGKAQSGDWKMDVRFNRKDLIERIRKISRYKSRIKLYQMDGEEFVLQVASKLPQKSFVFFDPPYIERSRGLYLNETSLEDHYRLAACISQLMRPWIVTYDMAAVKHGLYADFRRIVYGLHYTVNRRYVGEEVMYFSHDLQVSDLDELLGSKMTLIPNETCMKPRSSNSQSALL